MYLIMQKSKDVDESNYHLVDDIWIDTDLMRCKLFISCSEKTTMHALFLV